MTRKLTKRDMFTRVMNLGTDLGDDELVAFAEKEIALLDRKRNGKKTPTKTQLENVRIMDEMLVVLEEADEAMRATEVGNAVGITVQKATALLRKMVTDGFVTRVEAGKVTMFEARTRE